MIDSPSQASLAQRTGVALAEALRHQRAGVRLPPAAEALSPR